MWALQMTLATILLEITEEYGQISVTVLFDVNFVHFLMYAVTSMMTNEVSDCCCKSGETETLLHYF